MAPHGHGFVSPAPLPPVPRAAPAHPPGLAPPADGAGGGSGAHSYSYGGVRVTAGAPSMAPLKEE